MNTILPCDDVDDNVSQKNGATDTSSMQWTTAPSLDLASFLHLE
jgi:hypothetical protein